MLGNDIFNFFPPVQLQYFPTRMHFNDVAAIPGAHVENHVFLVKANTHDAILLFSIEFDGFLRRQSLVIQISWFS